MLFRSRRSGVSNRCELAVQTAEQLQDGRDLKIASIILELWLEQIRYVRQAPCGRKDPLLFSQKGQHLDGVDDFKLPFQLFKSL